MASSIPQPTLHQTTHTKEGKSIFLPSSQPPPFQPYGPFTSSFTTFATRSTVPIPSPSLPQAFPISAPALPKCPPSGLIFVSTDFAPGGKAPLHRTLTVDYCIVISGEITCLLAEDIGEVEKNEETERTLRAGDVFIQNGTNHIWENRGKEWCRVVFCMIGAEKIVTAGGGTLEDTQWS